MNGVFKEYLETIGIREGRLGANVSPSGRRGSLNWADPLPILRYYSLIDFIRLDII